MTADNYVTSGRITDAYTDLGPYWVSSPDERSRWDRLLRDIGASPMLAAPSGLSYDCGLAFELNQRRMKALRREAV
jgi:hypothetical protein